MEMRVLCALLTVLVLQFVLCDGQTVEDSHLCVSNFTVPVIITKRCRRGEICKPVKQLVRKSITSCCKGWSYSDVDKKCMPDCKRGCTQGTCVAPDVCVCDPPLILKNNISCVEPHCNPSCVNANCVDNDICNCHEGFSQHNATHCIPICPEGFINDAHDLACKPRCDNCVNGNCTAPNTCSCNAGYILENSTCVPFCEDGCKNGRCVEPGTCECDVGYNADSNKSLCRPVCDKACVNSTCDEPNKCECLTGYEAVSAWACKPKCDNCSNGECVAPDQCNCLEGYSKNHGTNCAPVCSKTCSNGRCSAPDRCTCNEGFELHSEDKFKCQPICKDGCVNATCADPNTCTCLPGFERLNSSACRPSCVSCENGDCVSPNICQCKDGFDRSDGTCKPICSSPCINGFCESPEQCACNKGYVKDLTKSICYKPCIHRCDNGKCNNDGECLCNSGYELFNSSCIVPESCDKCNATCPEESCRCADGRPCFPTLEMPAEAAPSTSLAGLQITWVLGGCVGILLVTIVIITIGYIWKKRKEYGEKPTDHGTTYPSVLYTIPNTLIQSKYDENIEESANDNTAEDTNEAVSLHLLEDGDDSNRNEVP